MAIPAAPSRCRHPLRWFGQTLRAPVLLGAAALAAVGLAGVVLAVGAAPAGAAELCLAAGTKARPYDQAVQHTRKAAEAVLSRGGPESCLRGKLTNALLSLSASCEAAGQNTPLCQLADRAVVQLNWTLPFMDATSRQLLDLSTASSSTASSPAPEAASAL